MVFEKGTVRVTEKVSDAGIPYIELNSYFGESVSGVPARTVGGGFSIRDKDGNIYDLPVIAVSVGASASAVYARTIFNLAPGSYVYLATGVNYPGFPTDPLNLPNGTYDVRSSLWRETSEPLSTRIGDSDWLLGKLVLTGAVVPELPPAELPVTPPADEIPPTVEPTLFDKFLDKLKIIVKLQHVIPGLTISQILGTYLGRAVQDEDIAKYTDKLVEFLPVLNVISKSTYGIDLTTGAKADIGDITEDEAIAAVLDVGFMLVGAKVLGMGMAAVSEARAASILSKIISNPAKLTPTGQRYAAYLQKSSSLANKLVGSTAVVSPKRSLGILSLLGTSIRTHPYPIFIIGLMSISQLDVIGWGFDSLPSQVRARQKDRYKLFQSLMFSLQDAIDVNDYVHAQIIAVEMRTLLEEIEDDLASRIPQFWENRGTNYDDIRSIVRGLRAALNAIVEEHPQIDVNFERAEVPEELRGTVTYVVDGDTFDIAVVGAPKPVYRVRMLMLDTHESGTDAGVIEGDKLEELIMNKSVIVLVDPLNQWGRRGRVLGMVVLETPEGL